MSSKKSDTKKTVLIIGAGAGATVARTISQKLSDVDIVLVEPLPYKALLPATLRLTVTSEGKLEGHDKAFIPLDKIYPPGRPGRVIQGQVVSIAKSDKGGLATLKSGETISWDILVLATGSKWTGPIAFPWFQGEEAVQAHIKTQRENIAKAKDIVIVGAGAIGIELSGELKDFYPEKNVTIVQGDKSVLNAAYPDKVRRRLESKVKAAGVNIIFNDYVDDADGIVENVTTRNGKEIKADLVLSARGPRPNTDLLHGTPFSSALTKSGSVKVKPTLQVEGFDDVFAVGDIIEWKEQKQAMKASAHAAIAAGNIVSLLSNGGSSMKPYKGSYEMIMITFGRGGGVGFFDLGWFSFSLGDWLARMAKSKNLLVDMIRPQYGQ